MELSYYMCVFLVATPFSWYQKIWPCDLDLDFELLLEKLELVAAGGISPVRTDPDLVWLVVFDQIWRDMIFVLSIIDLLKAFLPIIRQNLTRYTLTLVTIPAPVIFRRAASAIPDDQGSILFGVWPGYLVYRSSWWWTIWCRLTYKLKLFINFFLWCQLVIAWFIDVSKWERGGGGGWLLNNLLKLKKNISGLHHVWNICNFVLWIGDIHVCLSVRL